MGCEVKYEILEHTSDLFIKAYGKNIVELFQNMSSAMLNEMFNLKLEFPVQCDVFHNIVLYDENKEHLLTSFLKEILYYMEVTGVVPIIVIIRDISHIISSKIEKYGIHSSIACVHIDNIENIEYLSEIKAVTEHELSIIKNEDSEMFEATVLFDL